MSTRLFVELIFADFFAPSRLLLLIFILHLSEHVDSEPTAATLNGKHARRLEKLGAYEHERPSKEPLHVYSSSKANNFLSYDKCMQRMKCPVSRKEECSEECRAGNTEEEVEEHKELTMNEQRPAVQQKPKARFESESAHAATAKKQSSDQSTIKTDL